MLFRDRRLLQVDVGQRPTAEHIFAWVADSDGESDAWSEARPLHLILRNSWLGWTGVHGQTPQAASELIQVAILEQVDPRPT